MRRAAIPFFLLAVLLSTGCARPTAITMMQPFGVVETGIPELQKALAESRRRRPGRRR